MKVPILDIQNKKVGEQTLPKQFNEPVREDLIKRAVVFIQSRKRSKYASDPMAGKRASVRLSKRRHDYRSAYGRGQSRIPRKIVSRRGTQLNFEAAFAPGTVKGRRAHPPKATKILATNMNVREYQKAIRSALAATMDSKYISKRSHVLPSHFPFVLSQDFEKINKAKNFSQALHRLGLDKELIRTKKTKIRAGHGKKRGRKCIKRKGPLVIVTNDCALLSAGKNLPGVDIISINGINCEQLAPGSQAGRLTLYTETALKIIEKENLFMN